MTSPSAPLERLHPLIDAALSGSITTEQADELDRLLKTDREACEVYSEYASMEAELHLLVRGRTASHEVFQRILNSSDIAYETADDSVVTTPPIIVPSLSSPAAHLTSPLSSYLSSGWPVAYMVATVIFGIGLIVGALVHVSQPASVVRQSPLPSPSGRVAGGDDRGSAGSALSSVVARITGMVDCVLNNDECRMMNAELKTNIHHSSFITQHSLLRLGDRIALRSGLLKITYDTGATVILQGPVTYEVESAVGGYLSVGKLTAKLEKREEGRGGEGREYSKQRDCHSSFSI